MSGGPTTRAWLRLPRLRQQTLLARAQQDLELFAEFYAGCYEQVLSFFARRTLDPETAFDLMSETFASAFAALPSFRGQTEDEAMAWLWTTARHQLHNWIRRGKVEQRCLAELGVERPALSAVEFDRVEELAVLDQIKDEVSEALDSLVPQQRHAVRKRVVEERPYAMIAEQLGVSEQVARARVSRGLRELALKLESHQAALLEAVR